MSIADMCCGYQEQGYCKYTAETCELQVVRLTTMNSKELEANMKKKVYNIEMVQTVKRLSLIHIQMCIRDRYINVKERKTRQSIHSICTLCTFLLIMVDMKLGCFAKVHYCQCVLDIPKYNSQSQSTCMIYPTLLSSFIKFILKNCICVYRKDYQFILLVY